MSQLEYAALSLLSVPTTTSRTSVRMETASRYEGGERLSALWRREWRADDLAVVDVDGGTLTLAVEEDGADDFGLVSFLAVAELIAFTLSLDSVNL